MVERGNGIQYRLIIPIAFVLLLVILTSILINEPVDDSRYINEPVNITLESDYVKELRPVEYYELSDGTRLVVIDRNPFPFRIEISDSAMFNNVSSELYIYRIILYNLTEGIEALENVFGIDLGQPSYNMNTNTYIYTNNTLQFEFNPSSGFFRVIFNSSFNDYKTVVESNLLMLYPDSIAFISETEPVEEVNGEPLRYAIVYTGVIDSLPSPIRIVLVLDADNSSIVEIQGIIVKDLEVVSLNRLIPVQELPRLLQERVGGDIRRGDWYISHLGFTELTIKDIELEYTLTPEGLLVPIYRFEGEWRLDYDNLDYSGDLYGFIIAVTG